MAEKSRQLRAMLFADIVGYSSLVAGDEEVALDIISDYIELFEHFCSEHEGEIVQIRGDGVFALFGSAVNAVSCAVEAQDFIAKKNEVAQNRVEFRVGINLGDVLQSSTGVHGSAVNIASRLEGLADPGGVCISGAVYDQVKSRIACSYEALGTQKLKNIAEPIDVYAVRKEGQMVAAAGSPRIISRQEKAQLPNRPSVVVLPFKDYNREEKDSWFVEGITEDITSNLSRFHNLFVIARNSAFIYRNKDVRPQQAAMELGVRYVAQGTVRKAGNRARISVELVDAETERTIWAERYDRTLDDIFDVQDEIVSTVVTATNVQIEVTETERAFSRPPSDLAAYDRVLKAQQQIFKYRREDNEEARALYDEAHEIDPSYSRAVAGISRTLNIGWRYNWVSDNEKPLDQALDYALMAVRLDASDARGYGELGFAHLYRKEHDASIRAYEQALSLNPNDADLMADFADTLQHSGRSEDAVELFLTAMRLNPYYPDQYLWDLGGAYYNLKRYEDAISTVLKMNNPAEGQRLLAASYAQLGRHNQARFHASKVMEAHPNFSLEQWAKIMPDKYPEDTEHLVEGLQKAGL
ncbi:MAG: adenylate/guanylate cyclase domain-containing protein [Pseudomonadota bacterium]